MCEGMSIWSICKAWPTKVPRARTIYAKAAQRPELQAKLDQGYTVYLYRRIDILHRIAQQTAQSDMKDWRELEAQLKREIDETKFILGCMAEKIAKRFQRASYINSADNVMATHINTIEYNLTLKSGPQGVNEQ